MLFYRLPLDLDDLLRIYRDNGDLKEPEALSTVGMFMSLVVDQAGEQLTFLWSTRSATHRAVTNALTRSRCMWGSFARQSHDEETRGARDALLPPSQWPRLAGQEEPAAASAPHRNTLPFAASASARTAPAGLPQAGGRDHAAPGPSRRWLLERRPERRLETQEIHALASLAQDRPSSLCDDAAPAGASDAARRSTL